MLPRVRYPGSTLLIDARECFSRFSYSVTVLLKNSWRYDTRTPKYPYEPPRYVGYFGKYSDLDDERTMDLDYRVPGAVDPLHGHKSPGAPQHDRF